MPTTHNDAQMLALCLLAVATGLALVAAGVLLDPPLAILRHLHKEH